MDESGAVDQDSESIATPIFNVYRRGYDPEQVDRYVQDQQRRLDAALHRASESERKLAAAVGQLRELHRRVAVYESEARGAQPPALDTLGDRVQRILQEAWEGAYNLRQEAEREVAELREKIEREVEAARLQAREEVDELRDVASREAAELVDEATRRALALRDEMDRRRAAYLDKVERDRQRAVSQISYLYDQRQLAISELARLQATVQATVEEMAHSPLVRPADALAESPMARGTVEAEDATAGEDEIEREPVGAVQAEAELRSAGAGSLLSQFIEDADSRPSELQLESAEEQTEMLVNHEEIPTGPMEPVGYGLGDLEPPARPRRAADPEAEEDGGGVGGRRPYGGVYDAEQDGWA